MSAEFAGEGGGLLANVNRWRGQLGLPPVAQKTDLSKLCDSLDVRRQGDVVDFTGTDAKTGKPARLVGVIVPQDGQTWFYKLMGDQADRRAAKGRLHEIHPVGQISRCSLNWLIRIFTSLRLTVILLAFAIVLVFIGTLAQVDEGLYNAQARYFRQWIIFGLDLFGQKIPLILPGGYLIGTMLLVNLSPRTFIVFNCRSKKSASSSRTPASFCCSSASSRPTCSRTNRRCSLPRAKRKRIPKARRLRTGFHDDAGANGEAGRRHSRQSCWRAAAKFKIDNLPFTIRVKSFWKNSEPSVPRADDAKRAAR